MDYAKEITKLREHFKNYIKTSGLKSVVIGVSGGLDSSFLCALYSPIVKELGIELIGRSITINFNKEEEIKRSIEIGECFCTDFKHIDLSEISTDFWDVINSDASLTKNMSDYDLKLARGNSFARIRMIKLYHLAGINNGLVLSTLNRSEMELGYETIHGDVGDYEPLYNYWKSDEFKMAQWLVDNELTSQREKDALQSSIDCVPMAALGITESDVEEIGADNYDEIDNTLQIYLETGEILNKEVIKRRNNSLFKRKLPIRID